MVESSVPGIWQTGNNDKPITWPKFKNDWFDSRSLRGIVMKAFHEVWGNSYDELMKCVAERNGNAVAVGTLEGKPAIINSVCVFKRPN